LDLSTLQWETLTMGEHRIRQLAGLNYPIIPLSASPDGKSLVVVVQTGNPTGSTEIASWDQARALLAMIDLQDNAHWSLQTNATAFPPNYLPRVNWLPDGSLLWVDEAHKAFLGSEQNRRELNAPVPISQIEYASNNIAFAQAEDVELWRVDLVSELWEKVTTPKPPKAGALGGYFILARDGSYALAFQDGQMWRIPAKMGAIAEPLPDVKVEIVGRGGPSGPSPTQLANGSYWLIGLPRAGEAGIGSEGFVVDEYRGSIVTAKDLQLPEGYYISGYYASSDGRWLAVTISDDPMQPWEQTDVYLTPSTDFTAGRIVKGVSVVGWHDEAPAVIFRDNKTGAFSVARLPLADTTVKARLNNAAPPLAMLPETIFAVDRASPARVLQFDLDGRLLNTFDLSTQYESILSMRGIEDRLFLGVKGRQADNACTYALVEWRIEP